MLAPEFGPYAFLASEPTDSRAGRDYGAELRGSVVRGRAEYRLGVFQGARGADASRPFRLVARVVYDPFGAERIVYYSGTTLGTRRSLAFGASVDAQADYRAYDADLFADQPFPNGDALTVQVDVTHYDGGRTLPTLVRQRALLVEAGWFVRRARLNPFVQLARDDLRDRAGADQQQRLGGLAWWLDGHRLNLKAAYGTQSLRGARSMRLGHLTLQALAF